MKNKKEVLELIQAMIERKEAALKVALEALDAAQSNDVQGQITYIGLISDLQSDLRGLNVIKMAVKL